MSKWVVSGGAVAVFILGIDKMAHAQYVRSCGGVSPLTSQGAAPLTDPEGRPYTGTVNLQFIPSLCVSERYDTNVLYAPKTPGLKRDDFVTNVNPMLRVNHTGEYAAGYLEAGGFGETYADNSSLNYIGTADTLYLNLDKSIKRLLPNASLNISDSVRYTPTPPGFVNPAAGTSPSSPANVINQNIYAQGFLAYRTNNLSNSASVSTAYATTPTTSLNASYSYAILRFGSSQFASTSQALLFDTTTQTGTVGGKTQVSALDTLNVMYSHMESEYTPHTTSGPSNLFKTDTATLGWSRLLTPYLTAAVGGGGIVIDPGITTYAANASLVMDLPSYRATISYARSAFPNYAGGQTMIGDTVTLTAMQKIALQWQLNESLNYSHTSGGSSVGSSGSTAVTFTTYSAGVDLYYWVTRIWSTALSFDYMNINQEFGTTHTNIDRYAVTFSVKATWN